MRYLLYLGLIAFLLSLLTCLTEIKSGERAVVCRFGRVIDTPGPGLYVGLPWGMDRVYRVKVEESRSVTIGYVPELVDGTGLTTPPGQLLTGDHNLVNIQAVINYSVDHDQVAKFVFQQEQAETLVAETAETVLAEWVAAHGVDTVILKGKAAKLQSGQLSLRDALVQETRKRLAGYELGVVIKSASVTHLNPPSKVKSAFDDVFRAKAAINTKINEAKEYAAKRTNEAQAEAYQIEQTADAYYQEQKKLAEADAQNFEVRLASYQQLMKDNPYYLNVLWWDEVSQIYAQLKTKGQIDLLDHRLGAGGLDITQFPAIKGRP